MTTWRFDYRRLKYALSKGRVGEAEAIVSGYSGAGRGSLARLARVLVGRKPIEELLVAACAEGATDVVDLLLRRGADPLLPAPSCEESALAAACWIGATRLCEQLLTGVTAADRPLLLGPLRLAVAAGHLEVVRLLLDQGADARAFCRRASVASLARVRGDILRLLAERGGRLPAGIQDMLARGAALGDRRPAVSPWP